MNNNNRMTKSTEKLYKFKKDKTMYVANILDEKVGYLTVNEIIKIKDEQIKLAKERSAIIGRIKNDRDTLRSRNDQLNSELEKISQKGIAEYITLFLSL